MATDLNGKEKEAGKGVDSSGDPVIDPTANVLQLVEAAVMRLNDLRQAEIRRVDDLRNAESRRVDEQSELRAMYDEKLREAEAKRIDAIRAVDVNAVTVASERAAAQAAVLANQVSASAETLRTLVASSATAVANQLTQTITPITDRISLLEKAQYEGKGKEGVQDPMLTQMLVEIKALREAGSIGTGKSAGIAQFIGWILAGVAVVGFIISRL
jgi:hypothetical protein